MSVDWLGYGYAALVASGGVIGYVKAGVCVWGEIDNCGARFRFSIISDSCDNVYIESRDCQVQVLTCCVPFLSGSVPSLAAGLLFGGLAGFGAYEISSDPKNVWVSLGQYYVLCLCVSPKWDTMFLNMTDNVSLWS